jgi:LPXTG-site transpeptidase (sortase) family protein
MLIKGLSLALLGFGVFVLMQVVMPVLAFKAWEATNFDQSNLLIDPKPKVLSGDLIGGDALGVTIENVNNFPAFLSENVLPAPYPSFKLTISKLQLNNVLVNVNTNDFELNLAHLPGTALPGEKGNVFVTGHSSILPSLAKKQKALLAKLPSIKKGDEIVIQALGQKYYYQVMGLKVVDPKDVSVIKSPDEEGRYLTLMTCVPPGFNTKRLIVLAKLKQS